MTCLSFMKLVAFVALLPAAETFSLSELMMTSASSDGSWLDRAPVNWNRKMSGLPRPVSSINTAEARTRCRDFIRQPDSPAERALVHAGWILYGAVQSYGPTKVVTALSGFDGMCRPLGYQGFVYWEGRYAGTLSPAAMNSRTDGMLVNIRLVSATHISGEFARYKESDPLCCPTRTSHVTYEVRRDDLPLVAPISIDTAAVGAPPGESRSESDSGDAAPLFGRKWMLIEVDRAAVSSTKPYMEFDREAKRFAGDGGCNRISGGFEVDGTSLRFSRIVSTRRACLDGEVQRVETSFLKGLEQTTTFQIQGNILRFSAGGPPILAFKAEAPGSGGAPQEGRVTGTVRYLQRIALSPSAVVEVKLLDVSRADSAAVTIAEQVIRPAGRQVPIEFELRYDPRHIEEPRRYAIQARILEDGKLRFINTKAYPVITGGHPNTVDVIVNAVRR